MILVDNDKMLIIGIEKYFVVFGLVVILRLISGWNLIL